MPSIQENLNTPYPFYDQEIPYSWISGSGYRIHKPLAGPGELTLTATVVVVVAVAVAFAAKTYAKAKLLLWLQ